MWRARLASLGRSNTLKIGLAWRGGGNPELRKKRTLATNELARLVSLSSITFINLQYDCEADELAAINSCFSKGDIKLLPDVDLRNDFLTVAAIMVNLDLVISVDNSVAHLAGALNVPVWVLLPYSPDWRWQLNREDSPWYPSVRLFRQTTYGDWKIVIGRIGKELGKAQKEGEVKLKNKGDHKLSSPKSIVHSQEVVISPSQLKHKALLNNASRLIKLNRYDEAISLIDEALQLKVNSRACLSARADTYYIKGQLTKALDDYKEALKLEPTNLRLKAALGFLYLSFAKFETGWKLYEERLMLPEIKAKRNEFYFLKQDNKWDGKQSLVDATLLIYFEQGFGDAILFFRFLDPLKALGAKLVLLVDGKLWSLFNFSDPEIQRLKEVRRFHYWISAESLGQLFIREKTDLMKFGNYLACDKNKAASYYAQCFHVDSQFKVGFVWKGSPNQQFNHWRSIPIKTFSELFKVKGVSFYSLQIGADLDELTPFLSDNVIDLSSEVNNFSDTAAIVENPDLVITVCTSVAHLVGAMGKPGWVLLKQGAYWCWMEDGDKTPWYPSLRLFSQLQAGCWKGVIERVKEGLEGLASK